MSQSQRPGGLTALAVLNFIFGAFGCLVVLGALAKLKEDGMGEAVLNSGPALGLLFLLIGSVVLIIISGIGYLGLKKTMGRKMGSLYAIFNIAYIITTLIILDQDFTMPIMIFFIYPLITLLLLNTTFKEDFIN